MNEQFENNFPFYISDCNFLCKRTFIIKKSQTTGLLSKKFVSIRRLKNVPLDLSVLLNLPYILSLRYKIRVRLKIFRLVRKIGVMLRVKKLLDTNRNFLNQCIFDRRCLHLLLSKINQLSDHYSIPTGSLYKTRVPTKIFDFSHLRGRRARKLFRRVPKKPIVVQTPISFRLRKLDRSRIYVNKLRRFVRIVSTRRGFFVERNVYKKLPVIWNNIDSKRISAKQRNVIVQYRLSAKRNFFVTVNDCLGRTLFTISSGQLHVKKKWERRSSDIFMILIDRALRFIRRRRLSRRVIFCGPARRFFAHRLLKEKVRQHKLHLVSYNVTRPIPHGGSLRRPTIKRL